MLSRSKVALAGARCQTFTFGTSRPAIYTRPGRQLTVPRALETQEKPSPIKGEQDKPAALKSEAEEVTVKYGLEAGLMKAFTSKEGGASSAETAKQLLKQYGSAYLITSISFAIVSFALCYAAVSAGVDIAALLQQVGLQPSEGSETVGTFALAYAAHKALSPVRFPPTVALTPVVAQWLGKKDGGEAKQ